LYDELIEPLDEHLPPSISHLHIVPEGVLHYLPFGALLGEDGKFLVERMSLSVAPSVSILKLCRIGNPRRWRSMLLFADPDGRLPGSRAEVTQIANASPNRRVAVVGAEATQALLEENVQYYDILHIASHGRFDSRAPWNSHLELAGDELTVAEIGKLDLRETYLVTLSACETALGGGAIADVPDGDEWVGLNQAFLAAGTPTVMASLWPIDDRISSDFMIRFYRALEVKSKAEALAEVQRQFIHSADARHPFYWAAFTVIGDPM
jgi:CHAT domain-containing protein